MKIVIIGSGNLATQLALALKDANQEIVQIFSRPLWKPSFPMPNSTSSL